MSQWPPQQPPADPEAYRKALMQNVIRSSGVSSISGRFMYAEDSERFARSLILRGRVNRTAPFQLSAEERQRLLGDPMDWSAFSKAHLAKDADAIEDAIQNFRYPYALRDADGDYTVYVTALENIRDRAGEEADMDMVAGAANRLLSLVDDPQRLDIDLMTTGDAGNTIAAGDFVEWKEGTEVKRGRVVDIHTSGVVSIPGSQNVLTSSAEAPVTLLDVYKSVEGGWRSEGRFSGQRSDALTPISPLLPPRELQNSQWYQFKALSGAAELHINGEIGGYGEFSAMSFVRDLEAMSGPLTVYVNSYGGDVFEGMKVIGAISRYPYPVDFVIDGVAASTASFIPMSGRTVKAYENTLLMIHKPRCGLMDATADDCVALARALTRTQDSIAMLYAKKTGADPATLLNLMNNDYWMTAEEAHQMGFVDEVMPAMKQVAYAIPDDSAMRRCGIKNLHPTLKDQDKRMTSETKRKLIEDQLDVRRRVHNINQRYSAS